MRFRSLDVRDRASIASDLADEESRGIYAYEFSDGTWYIGKSTDVRIRHVDHLHEWRHKQPPLKPVRMLWASLRCSDQELDDAETQAIAYFEDKGCSLRNVMKTGRPRGNSTVAIDTGEGFGIPIPWERAQLPKSRQPYKFEEDNKKLDKLERLKKACNYEDVVHLLAYYVANTIPAPSDTAGKLWVATAMSRSTRNRICCLSCQNAETLVLFKIGNERRIGGFINVKRDEDGKLPIWWPIKRASYGTLEKAYALYFCSRPELNELLHRRRTLDCCYRANAELMRRGTSMYASNNNPYLVRDILKAIEHL